MRKIVLNIFYYVLTLTIVFLYLATIALFVVILYFLIDRWNLKWPLIIPLFFLGKLVVICFYLREHASRLLNEQEGGPQQSTWRNSVDAKRSQGFNVLMNWRTANERFALYLRPFSFDSRWNAHLSIYIASKGLVWFIQDHPSCQEIWWHLVDTNVLPTDCVHVDPELYGFVKLGGIKMKLDHVISLSLAGVLPLVGLGDGDVDLSPLGAEFEGPMSQGDSDWQLRIDTLIKRASLIFVVPWNSEGTIWEFEHILHSSIDLKKVYVLLPDYTDHEHPEEYRDHKTVIEETFKILDRNGIRAHDESSFIDSKYAPGCYTLSRKDTIVVMKMLFSFHNNEALFDEFANLAHEELGHLYHDRGRARISLFSRNLDSAI